MTQLIHPLAFVPQQIYQIGCGGTGSRLVSELRFFIRGFFQDFRRVEDFSYTLIDFDRLTASNFQRQDFFPWEISDKTKGQILVERYRDTVPIKQIPEPVNAETVGRIFSPEVLSKKTLVVISADNFLVVKQVFEHFLASATNDWLAIFTGGSEIQETVGGHSVNVCSGQAYQYGVVRGVPLFPILPQNALPDVFAVNGFGPAATGQGCGVDADGGAQTSLQNLVCVAHTMSLLNAFFKHGYFMPCIYFKDMLETHYATPIPLSTIFGTSVEDYLQSLGVLTQEDEDEPGHEYGDEDGDDGDEDEQDDYQEQPF